MGRVRAWWIVPLVLYLVLAATCVREAGVVGEVAAAWLGRGAPQVAVGFEPGGTPVWSSPPREPNAGASFGPLRAAQTRPLERLAFGSVELPLAVNTYTGALWDWPAWLAWHLWPGSTAPRIVVILLGGGVLLAVGSLARSAASRRAALLAGAVLATDWCFVYYRRMLGGTELALHAAALLVVYGLVRDRPGRWGWVFVGLAVGFSAKVTFVATGVALLVTRPLGVQGRGAGMRRGRWRRWAGPAGLVLMLWLPLLVANVHHALGLPEAPRVQSHDTLALQWRRLVYGIEHLLDGGAASSGREGVLNLAWFFWEPLVWFENAHGAEPVGGSWGGLRLVGWLAVAVGAGRAWRTPRRPADRVLRWLSVAVPLQILLLWLLNRDLHHLAQASPLLALLAGLSLARLGREGPRGGFRNGWPGVLGALLLAVPGMRGLVVTDGVMRTLRTPTITHHGQQELLSLVHRVDVEQLWTADYDIHGVFEVLDPDLEVRHAWGAVSQARPRDSVIVPLLRAASGGHLLVLRPTASMIYNLHPSRERLEAGGERAGVVLTPAGTLEDRHGPWAWLYQVEPGTGCVPDSPLLP